MLQTLYKPDRPSAREVRIVFNNVITPTNATSKTACTVKIKRLKLDTIGVVNTSNKPTPKTKIAAPRVAKISTMIKPSRAATAMAPTWRFSLTLGISVGSPLELACGRALISAVVEVMAAVMRLICSPILGTAAVFSRTEEEGERVARVASERRLRLV
jgi:hypothetical protein